MRRSSNLSLPSLFLLFSAQLASAAIVTVNNNGDPAIGTPANCAEDNGGTCTLRDAISAATGGSDTIVFSTDMKIVLASSGTLDIGFRNITIDATGKSVLIDGNHAATVLTIGSSVNVQVKHLTIQNGAAGVGGGVINYGILDLSNCIIQNNSSTSYGGGIRNDNLGTLTVSNSAISGNSTGGGGGGIDNSGKLVLIGSILSGNRTRGFGGGISNSGTLTLSESTFSGNSAASGGALSNNGAASVTNSTISGNTADNGGGLFSMGTLKLVNSTLSGNSAVNNGGGISSLSPPLVINSIVATNTQAEGGDIDSDIDVNSTGNLIGGDPKLGPLQNNGGPTQTLLPEPNSPAIDSVPCTDAPATDQRGVTRPQGIRCDIGSVEVIASLPTVPAPTLGRWALIWLGLMTWLLASARIGPNRGKLVDR